MSSKHVFSILAYNKSPYLQECIDSLKGQKIKSEIIICTSTPSDFLENIATKNNLQLFVNPDKNGIASDWNFALKQPQAENVTLAHQDDLYYPDYTEKVLKAAESSKDALIVFSNYDEIIHKNNKTYIRKNSLNFFVKKILLYFGFLNKNKLKKNKKRILFFGSPIGCPTVTFNKEKIGDFQFDKNYTINLDWKAWHDLSHKDGSFIWIKKRLVSHRIHPESETTQGIAEKRRQNEDLDMLRLFWPKLLIPIISKFYSLSYRNNKN